MKYIYYLYKFFFVKLWLHHNRKIDSHIRAKDYKQNLNDVYIKICRGKIFKKYLSKISMDIEQKEQREHIVFAILPFEWGDWYQFSINLAIMLYLQGYKITLLIDDLPSVEEEFLYKGITDISVMVCRYICQQFIGTTIEVELLSSYKNSVLDNNEVDAIHRICNESLVWLAAHQNKDSNKDNYIKKMLFNASKIKHYIQEKECDTLNVYTGLHFEKGIYNYFCQKKQLRCSTYDSAGIKDDIISFAQNDAQAHCLDIIRIINNNNILSTKAKQQMISTYREKYSSFELGKNEANKVGVFIPLNISWDAAAINVPCCFESEQVWLEETIRFILINTTEKIIIREHPARRRAQEYNYRDILDNLKRIEGYSPERIFFFDFMNDFNTYEGILRAKLVLPYTSTVGIEAIAMGVPIVSCTQSYYAQCGIGRVSFDKNDYFQQIIETLRETCIISQEEKEKALLALALHAEMNVISEYNEINTNWNEIDFYRMMNDRNIIKILKVVSEGKTLIEQNVSEKYTSN